MINLQDLMSFYKWNSTHVDMKKCEELKNDGLLNIKKHILHPIYLLNYTAKNTILSTMVQGIDSCTWSSGCRGW